MRQVVEVRLIENSTAGNPPKIFTSQTVEIYQQPDTVVHGVDGHVSVGHHPSRVIWYGGNIMNLKSVTDVQFIGVEGSVILEGSLNTHLGAPRNIDGGVEFFVLRPV